MPGGDPYSRKVADRPVTCTSSNSNSLLTWTIFAQSADVMKCQMYRGGGTITFVPSDIRAVLPMMFNMKAHGNQGFWKEVDGIVERVSAVLKDEEFKTFEQQYL